MAEYPTEVRFGVATANIQNLRDLSRPKTREALAIPPRHAALIGLQETIEAEDNEDIRTVMPPTQWYHFQGASENDLVVRRARFKPTAKARLPKGWAQNGKVLLSKGDSSVPNPHRELTWVILDFVDNPLFTPLCFADFHLVNGVDSRKPPIAKRRALREQQEGKIKLFLTQANLAGLPVIWVADTNWRLMPKMHPLERGLVNSTIDKIRFVPNHTSANWGLRTISTERHGSPSDHDVFVANTEAVANRRYVPPPKPLTQAERLEAWIKNYNVSATAAAELRKIVKG